MACREWKVDVTVSADHKMSGLTISPSSPPKKKLFWTKIYPFVGMKRMNVMKI